MGPFFFYYSHLVQNLNMGCTKVGQEMFDCCQREHIVNKGCSQVPWFLFSARGALVAPFHAACNKKKKWGAPWGYQALPDRRNGVVIWVMTSLRSEPIFAFSKDLILIFVVALVGDHPSGVARTTLGVCVHGIEQGCDEVPATKTLW